MLKNGIPQPGKLHKGGFHYSGNSHDIFEKFFGTSNPFAISLDGNLRFNSEDNGNSLSIIDRFQQSHLKSKADDLYIDCDCTLEEFFYGCKKELQFERRTLHGDERTETNVTQLREIEIRPGMGPWTELRFPQEGHEVFCNERSDLVVRLSEKPHPKFTRRGDDIVYTHSISLCEGLVSAPISFRTIDNDELKVAVDSVIGPETEKVIKGKGMPIENKDPLGPIKKTYRRGDLIIRFDIQFPTQLSEDVR